MLPPRPLSYRNLKVFSDSNAALWRWFQWIPVLGDVFPVGKRDCEGHKGERVKTLQTPHEVWHLKRLNADSVPIGMMFVIQWSPPLYLLHLFSVYGPFDTVSEALELFTSCVVHAAFLP